jgi:hypothetical protein
MPSGLSEPFRQSSPLRDGRPHPELGMAPPTRLNRYGLCARLTHQAQVEKGHVKLSKSHYQKWPSDRSESRFFSQNLCIALAICRSNPATARGRAHFRKHNKKSPLQMSRTVCKLVFAAGSKCPKRASRFSKNLLHALQVAHQIGVLEL